MALTGRQEDAEDTRKRSALASTGPWGRLATPTEGWRDATTLFGERPKPKDGEGGGNGRGGRGGGAGGGGSGRGGGGGGGSGAARDEAGEDSA